MSSYIDKSDYDHSIRVNRLDEILGDNDQVLESAEDEAIAIVEDALYSRFDTEDIFNRTGDDRHQNVLSWVKAITLYKIYERIPDEMVPERIVKNYNETMDVLEKIAEGKRSTRLPRLKSDDGDAKSKFRWGSKDRRTHDINWGNSKLT